MTRAFTAFLFATTLCAQDGTIVSGFVLDQVHGSGIPDASVSLVNFKGSNGQADSYQSSTDATGQFVFKGIKPGDYVASVGKTNYSQPATGMFNRLRTVHIGSTSDPIMLRFELIPPASLRGQVLTPDGEPAKDVWVDMGRKTKPTDDFGNFVFDELTPGAVTLVAYPKDPKPAIGPDGTRTEIVPTYYPSVIDRALAQSIAIQPGADQTGYQIRLQTALVSRVRGVAMDPSGKPLPKVVVELLSQFEGGAQGLLYSAPAGPFTIGGGVPALQPATTDPVVTGDDGAFEFPSVAEGDWLLRAESDVVHDETLRKETMMLGSLSVHVSRRDQEDLHIQLSPPFDMKGTVEMADGSPIAKNTVVGTLILSEDNGGASGNAKMQPDGSFVVENVRPGRSLVRASAPSGFYVASILLGNTNISGQSVTLTPASSALRLVLKSAATINAHVENCEKAMVLLVPHSIASGEEGRTELCSANGASQFRGLAPGDYYVIALDDFDVGRDSGAAQLRTIVQRATSIHVDEGSTISVDLKVAVTH